MAPVDASSRRLSINDRLEIRLIPDEGLRFDEALDAAWLEGSLASGTPLLDPTVVEAPRASLEVHRVEHRAGTAVRIQGTLELSWEVACVRCLEAVGHTRTLAFERVLLPPDPEAEGEPEHHSGADVDLQDVIREAVILALDPNPNCTDRPACDARTQALISSHRPPDDSAPETDTALDPRWGPLRALRDKAPR